jgi:hypothetical protein
MGYHVKHVIDVDLMTRSIKTHIKNKEKNTIFIIENLIKISLKKKPKKCYQKLMEEKNKLKRNQLQRETCLRVRKKA